MAATGKGIPLETYRIRARKLATAAQTLKRRSAAGAPFALAYLTDSRRFQHSEQVAAAAPAKTAVIFRDYAMPAREAHGARLAEICKSRGLLFLVAGDVAMARRLGADGVHAPSHANICRSDCEGMILTRAAHGADELVAAGALGADLVLLSPVFPTESHPAARSLGARNFLRLARQSPAPVIALGGVDETNALQLAGRNVAGLAAIGAFHPR